MDQQGSTRYLNPKPLAARCPHTSNTRFQRVTNQVAELDLIVNDALVKTGLDKVHLLGYSNGGPVVGKYLGDDASRQTKVAGVRFLASSFGAGDEQPSPTWPLGLMDRTEAMSNFNLAGATCRAGDGCVPGCVPVDSDCAKGLTGCPGQQDPAIQDPIWMTIAARDPVGAGWGPQPTGLSRYPIVSRFD
jgi:hypothetical protein